MPSIILDCPHCTANSMGFSIVYETPLPDNPSIFLTLGICGKCSGGVIVLFGSVTGKNTPARNSPMQCQSDPENFNFVKMKTYPSSTPTKIPSHASDQLKRYYEQAANALKRRDWDASGAMSRKVVDVSTQQLLGEDSKKYGNIKQRIDALAEKNAITPDLKNWAHEIRLGGNEASHDEVPYTEPEATELLDFADLYLTYVYSMPGRLKERKAAAHAEKKKSKPA
jgi:hypothetical protein